VLAALIATYREPVYPAEKRLANSLAHIDVLLFTSSEILAMVPLKKNTSPICFRRGILF
jgi:hypothetical protein